MDGGDRSELSAAHLVLGTLANGSEHSFGAQRAFLFKCTKSRETVWSGC